MSARFSCRAGARRRAGAELRQSGRARGGVQPRGGRARARPHCACVSRRAKSQAACAKRTRGDLTSADFRGSVSGAGGRAGAKGL